MFGLGRKRVEPIPPATTLPEDMSWVSAPEGWRVLFHWKGVDHWHAVPSDWLSEQDMVDSVVNWLRSMAYRKLGLPLPPQALSIDEPLRYDFPRSAFYLRWAWTQSWGWSLELRARVPSDEDRLFDHVPEPPHGWTDLDMDMARRYLEGTMELARSVGWR